MHSNSVRLKNGVYRINIGNSESVIENVQTIEKKEVSMFNPTVRDSFFGEFDSFFNTLTKPSKYTVITGKITPRANVSKDEAGYQISLAAPGLSRKDFNIEIADDVLTVSTENNTDSNEYSLRKEYSYHKFSRSWSLPENANIESVTAEYTAGILNLNIPIDEVIINKTKKIEVN